MSDASEPSLLADARASVKVVAATELEPGSATLLHVGTSQEFAQGHPPGARWAQRSWLEWRVAEFVTEPDAPIVTVCRDGQQSLLAAATLSGLGYSNVRALQAGTAAWRAAGLDLELGLSGVLSSPNDVLAFGQDRNYADMQHYLRWETALGEKYAAPEHG